MERAEGIIEPIKKAVEEERVKGKTKWEAIGLA